MGLRAAVDGVPGTVVAESAFVEELGVPATVVTVDPDVVTVVGAPATVVVDAPATVLVVDPDSTTVVTVPSPAVVLGLEPAVVLVDSTDEPVVATVVEVAAGVEVLVSTIVTTDEADDDPASPLLASAGAAATVAATMREEMVMTDRRAMPKTIGGFLSELRQEGGCFDSVCCGFADEQRIGTSATLSPGGLANGSFRQIPTEYAGYAPRCAVYGTRNANEVAPSWCHLDAEPVLTIDRQAVVS